MLQALHAEWQKARRRHDLVLCLTFAVILYLWLGSTNVWGTDGNDDSALHRQADTFNAFLQVSMTRPTRQAMSIGAFRAISPRPANSICRCDP